MKLNLIPSSSCSHCYPMFMTNLTLEDATPAGTVCRLDAEINRECLKFETCDIQVAGLMCLAMGAMYGIASVVRSRSSCPGL